MKTYPTFRTSEKLLVGKAAQDAWAAQEVGCPCGSAGYAEHSLSGSANDMPAKWLGCDRCPGSALGQPLVYQNDAQIKFAIAQQQQQREVARTESDQPKTARPDTQIYAAAVTIIGGGNRSMTAIGDNLAHVRNDRGVAVVERINGAWVARSPKDGERIYV